jgi:hypothetical protein
MITPEVVSVIQTIAYTVGILGFLWFLHVVLR